jgi:hypothetical protein
MRVLIWGRWLRSIHQGGTHSGNPSVLIRQVTFLQEMGVVQSAKQGQVVKIS